MVGNLMVENALALLLGIALNLLTTLKRRNDQGKRITPWGWCRDYPYTALLAVLTPATGAYIMGLEEISKVTAIGLGYAGSDATSSIVQGAKNKPVRP